MTRVAIELAHPEDDRGLRDQARLNPMEGALSLAFLREPSFFIGASLQGDFVQVNVGREKAAGRVVGMGTRAVRRGFLNGEPVPVGYLSDLRLEEPFRKGTVIPRAYRYLSRLHEDGRASLYFTVIFEDNALALSTIATGRAGLPVYEDRGRLITHAILPLRRRPPIGGSFTIRSAGPDDVPSLVACLNRHGGQRQFGLRFDPEDFVPWTADGGGAARGSETPDDPRSGDGSDSDPLRVAALAEAGERARAGLSRPGMRRFPGLDLEDFRIAVQDGDVRAAVAWWDQKEFKQTRVVGYQGWLKAVRPLYNMGGRLLGIAPYPDPGQDLDTGYAAFLAGDDPVAVAAVLRDLHNSRVGSSTTYYLIGMMEDDPLASVLTDYAATRIPSRVFAVAYPGDQAHLDRLEHRTPGVEIALL